MRRLVLIFVCCVWAVGCTNGAKNVQDENKAIEIGNGFLKAIMADDFKKAYDDYMSPGVKFGPKATLEHFSADWSAIKEKFGAISEARFDAWQLVPGKRALQLYYLISHAQVDEPIVYHLVLEGNLEMGYTIFLVDIGNEQIYPPNVSEIPEKHKLDRDIVLSP